MTNTICEADASQVAQTDIPTAIVGLNPLLCESLSCLVKGSQFKVVGLSSCIDELDTTAFPLDCPTLLIVELFDDPGGVCQQIAEFKRQVPLTRIVVLANSCAPHDVEQVVSSGANGYFATIATRDQFIKSLELVICGQTVLPSEGMFWQHSRPPDGARDAARTEQEEPEPVPVLPAKKHTPEFSGRELDVLKCLTLGRSNKAIARECDIAEGTVKVHVKAILRKINVTNRTQAAIWGLSNHNLGWPDGSALTDHAMAGSTTHPTPIIDPVEFPFAPGRTSGNIKEDIQKLRCVAGTDLSARKDILDGA